MPILAHGVINRPAGEGVQRKLFRVFHLGAGFSLSWVVAQGEQKPGSLDERLRAYRQKKSVEPPAQLVADLLAAKRHGDGLEVVEFALRSHPEQLDLLVLRGRALLYVGELEQAYAALLSASHRDPSNFDAHRYLGELLLRRGDPNHAMQVLSQAAAIDASNAEVIRMWQRAARLAKIERDSLLPAADEDEEQDEDEQERTVMREAPGLLHSITESNVDRYDDDEEEALTRVSFPSESDLAKAPPPPPQEAIAASFRPSEDISGQGRPDDSLTYIKESPVDVEVDRAPAFAQNVPSGESSSSDWSMKVPFRKPPLESVSDYSRPRGYAPPLRSFESKTGDRSPKWLWATLFSLALLAAGAVVAYREWQIREQAKADELANTSKDLVYRGDLKDLADAGGKLKRSLRIRSSQSTFHWLLLARMAQSLESLNLNAESLRPLVVLAKRENISKAWLLLAQSVLASASYNRKLTLQRIESAIQQDSGDPIFRFFVGRILERLGDERAGLWIEKSAKADSRLAMARIGYAEHLARQGEVLLALREIDQVLQKYPQQARASAWKAFWLAADTQPNSPPPQVGKRATAVEKLLTRLAVVRSASAQQNLSLARQEFAQIRQYNVSEPRFLRLVASEAYALGLLRQAEVAASKALKIAQLDRTLRLLLASIQIDRGLTNTALETLEPLHKDPDALSLRCQAALRGDHKEHAEQMQTWLGSIESELDSDSDARSSWEAMVLRLKLALHKNSESLKTWGKELTDADPKNYEAWLALTEIAFVQDDISLAQSAAKQMLALGDSAAEALWWQGRIAMRLGDSAEAEKLLLQASEISPEDPRILESLGQLQWARGKVERSEETFAKASVLCEDGNKEVCLNATLGLVRAQLVQNEVAAADAALDNVPQKYRTDERWIESRVRVWTEQDKSAQALSLIKEVQNPKPELVALHGDLLLKAEQAEQAATKFSEALKTDPNLPEALYGLAMASLQQGRSEIAHEIARQAEFALATRQRPASLRARILVVRARALLERVPPHRERASELLAEAVRISGVPPEAYYWLGVALAGSSQTQAQESYQRYLELSPDGKHSATAKERLREMN